MSATVVKQGCPKPSLVAEQAQSADYCDSFSAPLPKPVALPELVLCFFASFPSWVHTLMRVRGKLARIFGLAHPGGEQMREELSQFRGELGQSISLFEVSERSEFEILTRGDDTHLVFHLSFMQRDGSFALTTTVKFHRALGRWYFALVRPFHVLIMYKVVRRMSSLLAIPPEEWPQVVTE